MSWPTAALGDVATVVSGATPRTSEKRFWDGDILWTTPKDLSELETPYLERPPRTITSDGLKSCAASMLPANSVLLSSRAPIGLVAINSVPMATNQGFKSLVPDNRRLDSKFLYHWLKSKTAFLQSLGNGATFKEISKAVVERIEIPLPQLDEQRRIAAILDKADTLRRKRKHAIELLDSLTQSIFLEMFGDPVSNPRGWPTPTVLEVCNRVTVGIVVKPASYYQPYGIPAIRSLNIRENDFDLSDLVYISASHNEGILAKSRIYGGDVLIVRTGQPGKAAVVTDELDSANAIDILIASTRRDVLDPHYFCDLLNSNAGKAMVLENKRGQIQQHLNAGSLKIARLPIPPLDAQRAYVKKSQKLKDEKSTAITASRACDYLFSSLQHRAFSGHL